MKEKLTSPEFQFDTLAIYSIVATALLAFSKGIKRQIHERDGWQCTKCGASSPLEAAHISHKRNAFYNTVKNGLTLCSQCHLWDHIQNAGRNGLSKKANDWAIKQLRKRS